MPRGALEFDAMGIFCWNAQQRPSGAMAAAVTTFMGSRSRPMCWGQAFDTLCFRTPETGLAKSSVACGRKVHTPLDSIKDVQYRRRGLFWKEITCCSSAPEERKQSVSQTVVTLLKHANVILPQAVAGSTLLAFVHPPCFTWFSTRFYAPALGYLMFAVGINLSPANFLQVLQRPWVVALGYAGQFVVKPLLGVFFASMANSTLGLSQAMSSGVILMSCVSGAQLSNYATYIVEPTMAPLSIVMTALSTATAVFVTPLLTYLLLGRQLPVDVPGMVRNITQIVIVPIAAGVLLNRFAPVVTRSIKLLLPPLSVLVTCLCVGSPLACNIHIVRSWNGIALLLPVIGFHAAAFVVGYVLPKVMFKSAADLDGLTKTIALETGMQSSLLSLALANTFFEDPMVGIASAVSVVIMTLMGFGLASYWKGGKADKGPAHSSVQT